MCGYRVCYQRLVFSRDLLSNPDLEFEYIPIDSLNCLVLVKSCKGELVPTFLPAVMEQLCEQRKAVRRTMRGIGRGFEYDVLNSSQLACKVLQNSAYGFLGVSVNGLFACPVLMATVTAIGRFMIKTSRSYCEQKYNAVSLYGDTDSIMVRFPFPRANMPEPECFDYLRKLCTQIGEELTAMFARPNEMEFESV